MDDKILVVEDVENCWILAAHVIEDSGYKPIWAQGAYEAIELLRHKGFKLMLVDQELMGASGFEIIDVIQRSFPVIRIAMLTGYASPQLKLKAALKNVELVEKPVTKEKLQRLLSSSI